MIKKLVSSETFAEMEAESRKWLLTCAKCGHAVSVWDVGGIRYRAASKHKMMPGRCPKCGTWQMFPVVKEVK